MSLLLVLAGEHSDGAAAGEPAPSRSPRRRAPTRARLPAGGAAKGAGTPPADTHEPAAGATEEAAALPQAPEAAPADVPAQRAADPPEDATRHATEPPPAQPADGAEAGRLERSRQLLQEAIRRSQAKEPFPTPGGLRPFPGMRVDKYFGTKLPPVCASLGCYVTDDGKRFYCVNPACQKHKKRETKHTRKGNPAKARFVYFRCPRCESRSLEMHLLSNRYVCRACKYSWTR